MFLNTMSLLGYATIMRLPAQHFLQTHERAAIKWVILDRNKNDNWREFETKLQGHSISSEMHINRSM